MAKSPDRVFMLCSICSGSVKPGTKMRVDLHPTGASMLKWRIGRLVNDREAN